MLFSFFLPGRHVISDLVPYLASGPWRVTYVVIRVIVRCKPTKKEKLIHVEKNEFVLQRPKTNLRKQYPFERVVTEQETTPELYKKHLCDLVDHVLRGRSSSVIAFGAGETGKSFTTRGADGLVKSFGRDIFNRLRGDPNSMLSLSVLMSAITAPVQSNMTGRQITHEVLLDGLLPAGDVGDYRGGLHVREHPSKGFFVEGLSEVVIEKEEELEKFVESALTNCSTEDGRRTSGGKGAPLKVHCLFSFKVRRRDANGMVDTAELQIVDLAGYAREKKGGAQVARGGEKSGPVGEDIVLKAFLRITSRCWREEEEGRGKGGE
eukprot:461826-Hanusia_phi.AAC.1